MLFGIIRNNFFCLISLFTPKKSGVMEKCHFSRKKRENTARKVYFIYPNSTLIYAWNQKALRGKYEV